MKCFLHLKDKLRAKREIAEKGGSIIVKTIVDITFYNI